MPPVSRPMELLLLLGLLLTCGHADTTTADPCTMKPVNETVQCANVPSLTMDTLFRVLISKHSPCIISPAEYACAEGSLFNVLTDDFFIQLGMCYSNMSQLDLAPQFSVLILSKLDSSKFNSTLAYFSAQFSNLSVEWSEFLFVGVLARASQAPNISNATALGQLFQTRLQPFLSVINTASLACLLKNASCQGFQEVVKGLNMKYSQMPELKQREIYSIIYSFLMSKQNATGSACVQGGNSSLWVEQNFGRFSKFAKLQDFMTLNKNFSAGDVLPFLSMAQLVNFTMESGALNDTALMAKIASRLQSANDIQVYLTQLRTAVKWNNQTLSPEIESLLRNRSIQVLLAEFPSYGPSNWTDLFQNAWNLAVYNVSASQLALIPRNITCDSYQAIVKAVNANYANITLEKQKMVYDVVIKPYLSQNGSKPKCLNTSDTTQNSNGWLVRNMGSFLTYATIEDLALFANESNLQALAKDPANLQLAASLNLSKEMDKYYTALLTSPPGVNLSRIPGKFLCVLSPSALKNVSEQEALNLAQRLSENCLSGPRNASTNETGPAPVPTPEELQVAVSLVNKLKSFNADTIKTLGPAAVGLSPSQIGGISDKDLEACLPTLSNVNGWNSQQSSSIVDKLFKSGFKLPNLQSLGSLVTGVTSSQLQNMAPERFLEAVNNLRFKNQLSNAPAAVKNEFFTKIASISSTPASLIRNIPDNLVSFIPKASLVFKSEKTNVSDLNSKTWSPDQAAMFFPDVVKSGADLTSLSPYVLQGFSCAASNTMDQGTLEKLAKAMKEKKAQLGEEQLACLTKRVTSNGIPNDFDKYPQEMLLFISPSNYSAPGGCKEYFRRVGAANVSVLPPGSQLRKRRLSEALACLNISGTNVTLENAQVLGGLACDLGGPYIEGSVQSLLPQLTKCKSFTADQGSAIQKAIASGNTQFGPPSQWSSATLQNLGGLLGSLNGDFFKQIPQKSLIPWLTNAAQTSDLPKSQISAIIKSLVPTASSISSRIAVVACPDGKQITADNVKDVLLPTMYSPEELDACLDTVTLVDYLSVLGGQAFTDQQLSVLKNKLDQIFPAGYPENLLPSLGAIFFQVTENDILKWNITSVDTLQCLLSTGPPDSLASAVIGKYTNSGNPLSALALNAIRSRYVCLLNETQLNGTDPTAVREAMALDTSACNESVKNILYSKAKVTFQDVQGQMPTYYNLIKPYIGGASADDIKVLAKQNVSMDINTFINLKPSTVMNLTADDVKALLGVNLGDLKAQQNNTVVSSWIQSQKQSELDKLGLGLQGGRPEDVTGSMPTSVTQAATNATTTYLTQGNPGLKSTTNGGFSTVLPLTGPLFGCLYPLHILLISSLVAFLL